MRNSQFWYVVLMLAASTAGYGQEPNPPSPSQKEPPAEKEASRSAEKEITMDVGGGVTMELVLIPAGSFIMGTRDGDEQPPHKVKITKPFYLGKYEVTQEQWKAVMGNNPSRYKGAKYPVETASWDDCQAFLTKLNAKLADAGKRVALPTEAQWEYACRAGSTTRYSFGDDEASLGTYAWYDANSGDKHGVGQKKPNAWGLHDMHGSVWEWCQDWYKPYYAKSPTDDPTGPTAGSLRAARGGGRSNSSRSCRSANRGRCPPVNRESDVGFRVATVPVDAPSK